MQACNLTIPSIDGYDLVMIVALNSAILTDTSYNTRCIRIGEINAEGGYTWHRDHAFLNATTLEVRNCYYTHLGSPFNIDNTQCHPTQIFVAKSN